MPNSQNPNKNSLLARLSHLEVNRTYGIRIPPEAQKNSERKLFPKPVKVTSNDFGEKSGETLGESFKNLSLDSFTNEKTAEKTAMDLDYNPQNIGRQQSFTKPSDNQSTPTQVTHPFLVGPTKTNDPSKTAGNL